MGAKLSNEFYYLSTRVKYGMGRELVPIANRHIITLDRKTILKIGQLAKKHSDDYENTIVFLKEAREEEFEKVITMEMRDQIVSTIDQRYLQNSFEDQDDIKFLTQDIVGQFIDRIVVYPADRDVRSVLAKNRNSLSPHWGN